jgi:hypothetical protein
MPAVDRSEEVAGLRRASRRRRTVCSSFAFGTLAGNGGEFEQVYVLLARHRAGGVTGVEFFEPEDLDVARAGGEGGEKKMSSISTDEY